MEAVPFFFFFFSLGYRKRKLGGQGLRVSRVFGLEKLKKVVVEESCSCKFTGQLSGLEGVSLL
jgi:hypothetical protein